MASSPGSIMQNFQSANLDRFFLGIGIAGVVKTSYDLSQYVLSTNSHNADLTKHVWSLGIDCAFLGVSLVYFAYMSDIKCKNIGC